MRRLLAIAAVLGLLGCGRSISYGPPTGPCVFDSDCQAQFPGAHCVDQQCVLLGVYDGGRAGLKRFGQPCAADFECQSLLCLAGPRGAFCTQTCTGSCPEVMVCKHVPRDGGALDLCAVAQPLVCQPCSKDTDCGATGADLCLSQGDAGFCAQDCTWTSCPQGYACDSAHQCAAEQSCDCTPVTQGELRGCGVTDPSGTCYASQLCTPAGWTQCEARLATPEVCNGIDDDCNGLIDDGLPPRPCSRSDAGGFSCKGTETCRGSAGWSCDAKVPMPETCNYVDDDCDGVVDNGFVDDAGRYVGAHHCGGCGNDCASLVPHATSTACVIDARGAPACIGTACQPGFFLYGDAGACLALEDSLCRSCAADVDCVGPGSRCLSVGAERVCGRDCSPQSPYGNCPSGYACLATDAGGPQCQPTNATCECKAGTLGTRRSCSFKTCNGYQFCEADGGGPAWTGCDINDYNPLICDGLDNHCDGLVDEGFRDPATGKYDLNPHDCGFCGNDCTKYWSPDIQHTTGVCDSSPPMPTCVMGPCLTEVDGGVTYEWVDVDKSAAGCLCERVQGNTTVDPPKLQPPYTDANCDGIDGVIGDALFVWGGAAGGGNGSMAAPFRTIGQGLAALSGSGKKYVLVAQGDYAENAVLFSGAQLFGGYSPDFKARDPVIHTSIILGQAPLGGTSGGLAAVHAENIGSASQPTVVSGFTLQGHDVSASTPNDQDGPPSYAVYIKDSDSHLVLANNEILAGRGGPGGNGSTGPQGYGRQLSTALDGTAGQSSGRNAGGCPSGLFFAGGLAGANAGCPSSGAQPGGDVICPAFNWGSSPVQGQEQQYTSASNGNGAGGWDWSFDFQSGPGCTHVTESGFPQLHQSHDGRDGKAGADGVGGGGGPGAPAKGRSGSIAGGQWVPSPFSASFGAGGSNALGGGGGGAGGGVWHNPSSQCNAFEFGATGGGGGAGGCGGFGGRPGRAGGASITVLALYSSPPATLPQISNNRIARSFGGAGGNGGFGGAGGLAGQGAFGGTPTTWSGSTGGKGGEGGNGGPGGGGGGGSGGPSYGVLALNADTSAWSTQNTFTTGSGANTGGAAGAAGSSAGSGTGTAGVPGAFADVLTLKSCSVGCPPATTCDANGICVPN